MIVKETCKKIVTWFLLICNVFTLVPLTVFADTIPSKGEIKDPVVEAGKLEKDGDIQIIKTVTKVNDTGKYNVSFTVKGMPVEEPTERVKPIYVAVVFDRSGSMYCSNGTTTYPSYGSSTKVATINGQDIYCESKRDVYKDKWSKAVKGAIDFSKDLVAKSDTYVSLVTFASSASKATKFSRNAFAEKDFGYPNGGTDLAGGIKAATEALNTVKGDVQKFILVIGDGEPTFYYGQQEWCGWDGCTDSTDAAKNEANTAKDSKIKIFSVGYGVSKDSNAEKILMAISSNKEKNDKYYISASTSGISEALNTVVKEMNTIAAGKNATLKDTIGGQFTYVSSNNENVKNNGDVVTYKIDEITEEGITFDFDIQIKEETPTGWYDTNDFANNGVILEYTDAYGKPKTISFDKSSKVYWVGNKYDYTINYYKDSISEGNHLGTVSGAAEYNETITADTTKYLPEGYKFVGEVPSMIIKTEGNNIDVIYVKDTFNYVINYYKDSKSEDNYLGNVSDSALYGDKIVADTTKYLPEGYKFVGVEPSMVIKTNGNVIDVIYTKENYNYTINYYKDSISLENHLGTVSESALYGDEIIADTTKYLPEGYKFVGEAPSMIIKTEGNNIDVIYVKDTFNYVINYYKDSKSEDNYLGNVSDSALYGDKIVADTTKYLPEGYKFVGVEPSMVIKTNGNVIDVIYTKENYNYTINYYKDSISLENHLGTVSESALYGDEIIADTTKYLPEGYKFVGEVPSMIIKTEGNNIDVIYVKDTFNYVINYYKDSKSEDNYLGNVSDSALYGDKIVADTTKYLPEGYKFVGVEPSMVIKTNGNVIDVIYTKENYNYTINYYKDSISLENHLGTVSESALYGDEIIADTTKYLPEGYKFVGEVPSMIIKTEGNNIDVIYVKDTFNYVINYYKDSKSEDNYLGNVSDSALYGDKIVADTTKYLPEGYKFVGVEPSMVIKTNGNVIDVIYTKENYNYTINYYKDSISLENHLGTVSESALYGDEIIADTTKYLPEGYKFVGEAPSMIIKTEGNNIDVIYVKDTFNYVINYYKDSKSDDNYLGNVSDSALYGDKIVADTTKYLPEGYKFVGVEPSMVIKTNGNVIDVIYTKENYNYTINYYKDSISLENHLGTVSESALYGDEIIADTTKYLPEGYKFVGETPSMIIKTEGNNIDVIYVKKELIYTVEYYFDGIIDEQLTEEYTALYGDIISEYVDKAKENYILDINNPVNVPLVISEKDNVIKVYYVYDEGEIIPPYTGSTDNGLFNLLFFLASVLIITKINLKTKEN